MENNNKQIRHFVVKDCALIALATGDKAQNLRELRDRLEKVEPGCLYYHFWGILLKPSFEDPEYNNDFASWAKHSLHDGKVAEKLAVIDPTDFKDMETLRREVIEVIEEQLYESEIVSWCKLEHQFNFITSQIVIFDTGNRIETPEELTELIPTLSVSSIFYHFIDARRRTPEGQDDFRSWLSCYGDKYYGLIDLIANVDPYFYTLNELRDQLSGVFYQYFKGK